MRLTGVEATLLSVCEGVRQDVCGRKKLSRPSMKSSFEEGGRRTDGGKRELLLLSIA